MGRKSQSNYVEAARTVLTELGGGPISSKDLVAAAQERGLISGEKKWIYHNFLRKIRESEEFDTSRRGYVSLAAAPAEVPVAEAPEAPVNFPGPVLPSAAPVEETPEPEFVAESTESV